MARSRCGRRWIGRAARLVAGRSGATAIEFAMVAPVFLLLAFGIIETGLVFTGGLLLDSGVGHAARQVRLGNPQSGGTKDSDFRSQVCAQIGVLMSCDAQKLYLSIETYPSYAAMDLSAPLEASESYQTAGAYSYGAPGDIVVVRAFYKWPTTPIYNGITLGNLKSGERLLASFAAFRNEPYGS